MRCLPWVVAFVTGLGACATVTPPPAPIHTGEQVQLDYTCRLADGMVATTTSQDVAQDPTVPKADIFTGRGPYRPVTVTAGEPASEATPTMAVGFSEALVDALARQVVGLRPDAVQAIDVSATTNTALSHGERFAELARVRRRPMEARVKLSAYRSMFGQDKTPVVGEELPLDSGVIGKVVEVTDSYLTLHFHIQPGATVPTAFGLGHVRVVDDHYEIDIDARQGKLVRAGPLVGRITSVNDTTFTVDFGHPFGGEVLHCEVSARRAPVGPETAKAAER